MSKELYRLREEFQAECADIMLMALRKEAGVFLTADEYYRAKEALMRVIGVDIKIS